MFRFAKTGMTPGKGLPVRPDTAAGARAVPAAAAPPPRALVGGPFGSLDGLPRLAAAVVALITDATPTAAEINDAVSAKTEIAALTSGSNAAAIVAALQA